MGFDVEIKILVKTKEKEPEKNEEPAPTVSEPTSISESLTFENFIKGKSNELAYAFCIAVAGKNENSGNSASNNTFNPLFYLRRFRSWKNPPYESY